jgi:hypothetical protein
MEEECGLGQTIINEVSLIDLRHLGGGEQHHGRADARFAGMGAADGPGFIAAVCGSAPPNPANRSPPVGNETGTTGGGSNV